MFRSSEIQVWFAANLCWTWQGFVEKNFLTPLDKNGYEILNHHLNFIPGNAIADNILIAIRQSRYIMPIITENFLKSNYCIYELEQSVLRMIKSKSTCIIPVTADIKLLPECLKSLVTSVVLEDKYIGYSTHVDRIKKNIIGKWGWINSTMHLKPICLYK